MDDGIKLDMGMDELRKKAEACDSLMLQIADLQKKADEMKALITVGLVEGKLTSLTTANGDMFELQTKVKYLYKDENAMISWMKGNGYGKYIKEKISVASFNSAYKSGKDMKLTESMHPMMQASTVQELHFVTKESKDKSCSRQGK